MEKFKPIAIIGMSGRFPLAESLEQLDSIFSQQVDAVRPMSRERKALFGIAEDFPVHEMAYLDVVAYFDYDFFNISKHEAAMTDPQSRMAIELACGAVEDAGYRLSKLAGTKTSVYIGAHSSHYQDWLNEEDGMTVMGNLKDTMAGRISYLLDLRGDAAVLETSCSSSLYAIYHGCLQLSLEECDLALAGGVTLDFQLHRADKGDDGLSSSDGRCKAFDQRADGINGGEGGGMVLLKRLDEAVRDKDPIWAVIRSAAANQDGGRSNSVAAPSSTAQTEVLLEAWRRGQVLPQEIGYFEAHGTGTKLGDPIEISGITEAYRRYTNETKLCPIGSLKTNFAHLGASAGIAGVVKLVLSMSCNKRYPLRDFKQPNPFIDFERAPVYPAKELTSWPDGKKKVAAVSAFGISGTNVHLVLEEAPADVHPMNMPDNSNGPFLITVSGKTKESLENYCGRLAEAMDSLDEPMENIAYTLNRGRDDYDYRRAFLASDKASLTRQLREGGQITGTVAHKVILLCSKINSQEDLAFGKAVYDYLKEKGISIWKVIGAGTGNAMMSYLTKSLSLEEANRILEEKTDQFDAQAFGGYIEKLEQERSVVYVEIGRQKTLIPCLPKRKERRSQFLSPISGSAEESGRRLLPYLYESGVSFDWDQYYQSSAAKACHLPTYPFQKTKVWPSVMRRTGQAEKEEADGSVDGRLSLKEFLRTIWIRELEIDQLGDEEDLFELGANSLMGMSILKAIEERTGVVLDFDLFYDYCTIAKLTQYLEELTDQAPEDRGIARGKKKEGSISAADKQEWMPVSYNQRRMLFLLESIPDPSVYNMPNLFSIEGDVNPEIFQRSVEQVVANHDILHTLYKKEDGEYYQKILKDYSVPFCYEESGEMGQEALMKEFMRDCRCSFQLYQELPLLHKIVRTGEGRYYWFINVHHIAADGWSVGIFMKEFLAYFQALSRGTSIQSNRPHIQYADYAVWENQFLNSEAAECQMAFWKKELDGFSGILKFPIDKKRPAVQTFSGKTKRYEISSQMTEDLKAWGRKNALSLFMVLESAYALTLYQYTGQADIGVGVPIANRSQDEIQGLIGFFSNTVVVRNRIQPEQTLLDFLKANGKAISLVYQNTQLPFEEVVSQVSFERRQNFSPLFQYSFVLQNYGNSGPTLDDVGIRQVESVLPSASRFEMTFNVAESPAGLEILAEYNTDLFFDATIDAFIEQYMKLLRHIIQSPDTIVNTLQAEDSQREDGKTPGSFLFY